MTAPIIQKTKSYEIFNSVKFNRTINKRHLEEIKNIIRKDNKLHLHPILVNEKMEVIDGQHRLQSARELEVDIYYVQENISYDHILGSNLFQKKLLLEDVIKFYVEKDQIPSYISFYQYLQDLEMSPKALIGLLFGTVTNSMIDFIKSGKFQLPSNQLVLDKLIENFRRFKEFTKEKRITPFSMFASWNFTIAYRNLVLLSEFREQTWMNKLELRWFDLKPQLNSKEWTKQLINIYNWKNHTPISYGDS